MSFAGGRSDDHDAWSAPPTIGADAERVLSAAMKRLRYLNPFFIRAAVRDLRRALGGGGPRLVRVLSVDHPQGWFIPASTITIEVEAADGHTETFQPAIPIPFPWAWAYRIGRRLGVPIVSSVKPEHFGFKLALPGAGRRS